MQGKCAACEGGAERPLLPPRGRGKEGGAIGARGGARRGNSPAPQNWRARGWGRAGYRLGKTEGPHPSTRDSAGRPPGGWADDAPEDGAWGLVCTKTRGD